MSKLSFFDFKDQCTNYGGTYYEGTYNDIESDEDNIDKTKLPKNIENCKNNKNCYGIQYKNNKIKKVYRNNRNNSKSNNGIFCKLPNSIHTLDNRSKHVNFMNNNPYNKQILKKKYIHPLVLTSSLDNYNIFSEVNSCPIGTKPSLDPKNLYCTTRKRI